LLDQFARDAAPVVADICAKPSPELAGQCEAIIDAALDRDIGALQTGLRALFPEEVLAERLALVQQADIQFNNVDARLNELRGGSSGLSLAGLNLQLGKTFVPMGLLQSVFSDDEEPEVGGSGDLISPWGFFVNGTYGRGSQTASNTSRALATDFDNTGLTGGVDYRLSARTVLGAALGYSKFDSDLADGGATRSKTLTLTGYGSHYFSDQFYADARFTFGNASFDTVRRIRFSYQNFSIDKTAFGSTDARQYALGAGMGYHLQKGAWTITPNANFRYFRSKVDGYTETGAGANNVIFGNQTVDSMQYNLGVQIGRPISLSHGVLAPQFDLSYGNESKNADFALNARLVGTTSAGQNFVVRAQDADKSYGNVGIGFVYVTSNGKQAYLNYRRLFANDSIDRDTINLGARFEF
jgi:outer membrane autotransporter protein